MNAKYSNSFASLSAHICGNASVHYCIISWKEFERKHENKCSCVCFEAKQEEPPRTWTMRMRMRMQDANSAYMVRKQLNGNEHEMTCSLSIKANCVTLHALHRNRYVPSNSAAHSSIQCMHCMQCMQWKQLGQAISSISQFYMCHSFALLARLQVRIDAT